MGKESHSKHEPAVEEVKVKSVEEEIKLSKNTSTDKDGTIYSCHFEVTKNDKGENLFNGYNKLEILNPRLKGLNLYARLCNGRYKQDKKEVKEQGKGITREAFEAFLEIIKCPVWLEVMQDPVNVKTCLHKFWNKCIEGYTRIEKKECPTCRTSIGSRRLLRKDNKLREIIERLLPSVEDYQIYEQEEVQRNIKAISKSDKYKKQMLEIQKIKERQYRAEIEERKDSKTQKSKLMAAASRRIEPKPRQFLNRPPKEPIIDKKYRPIKRQKTEELKYDPNIKFKIKQLSSISSYPWNPKPGERIVQKMILETNDNMRLKHLIKFIKLKASTTDLENRLISFFVRSKNNRSKFDKITSLETSLKDLQEAYWPEEKMQTVYFMV